MLQQLGTCHHPCQWPATIIHWVAPNMLCCSTKIKKIPASWRSAENAHLFVQWHFLAWPAHASHSRKWIISVMHVVQELGREIAHFDAPDGCSEIELSRHLWEPLVNCKRNCVQKWGKVGFRARGFSSKFNWIGNHLRWDGRKFLKPKQGTAGVNTETKREGRASSVTVELQMVLSLIFWRRKNILHTSTGRTASSLGSPSNPSTKMHTHTHKQICSQSVSQRTDISNGPITSDPFTFTCRTCCLHNTLFPACTPSPPHRSGTKLLPNDLNKLSLLPTTPKSAFALHNPLLCSKYDVETA